MPTITVSNLTNQVNGDTLNAAALIANSGGDGISLREAILAANGTPGSTTILFSPSLAGQAIIVDSARLPTVTHDGVTIIGLVNADGSPAIAIHDASTSINSILLQVTASHFSLSHLAFAELGRAFAINIQAPAAAPGGPPSLISDISITDNTFSNAGYPGTLNSNAIYLNTADGASNATVENVLIAHNSFSDFLGEADGVLVGGAGANNTFANIQVRGNTFTNVTYGVEFAAGGATGERFVNNQVVGNTFVNNMQPINLNILGGPGPPTTGNLIDSTEIANNVILASRNPSISLNGGLDATDHNQITNTAIVNNLISGGFGQGIAIYGNGVGGSANLIDGVRIINDTIVNVPGPAVSLGANNGTAITNVTIANTLFFGNAFDVGSATPLSVTHSLTALAPYAGVGGNIGGNPLFVDAAHGDFHLAIGSPAIGAGDGNLAPPIDLAFLGRFGLAGPPPGDLPPVDIGAFQTGAPAGGETINGGAGNDQIEAGGGSNYLRGNAGDDVINGGDGFDDINGNMGADTLHGFAGDDWVVGGKDNDMLFGDAGDDIVYGNLGNDTCVGGIGNDLIRGGQGDDLLTGGAGDDWLSGDRGSDTLSGGAGADIFHTFNGAGLDVVVDFNAAEGDRVQLDPGTTFTLLQVGADTIIDLGAGEQMILRNVQLSTLPPGWIFGA